MIDSTRLAAYAALTALVSVVPGPNMLFVLGQSAWRKARGGALALAGLQAGNVVWFMLAGLGLGTLLEAWPLAFRGLTMAGAAYLAWLGIDAWRRAGSQPQHAGAVPRGVSEHPFRDGIVIALSNPKALVFVAALLPPFVDMRQPVAPQMVVLGMVGIGLDVAIGLAYIVAGSRLAEAMSRPHLRRIVERTVGALFVAIAVSVVVGLFG